MTTDRPRVACVDIRAFALQLLHLRQPDWQSRAVALIADDRPNAPVLEVNARGLEAGIRPGLSYARALALEPDLRAATIDASDIEAALVEVCESLRTTSPSVEIARDSPGIFWLEPRGMKLLFGSLRTWAQAVQRSITGLGYRGHLVVGFSRFSSRAIARAIEHATHIFKEASDEALALDAVPVDSIGIDPDLRNTLERLGIHRLGTLLQLPNAALAERFGPEIQRLHAAARGELWDPLHPERNNEPVERRVIFDDGVHHGPRILLHIERSLASMLDHLTRHGSAIEVLFVEFCFERGMPRHRIDDLRPAEPTLDLHTLMRLMGLRIESTPLERAVVEITISVAQVPATSEQLTLFQQHCDRRLSAANEALARIRAELGNRSVQSASLREGHLPEARFSWNPLTQLKLPAPRNSRVDKPGRAVRRLYTPAKVLPPQNRHARDDGWLLAGLESGPVVHIRGPHLISGAWWASARGRRQHGELHREYHYAQTRSGQWLWVYYDKRRRRWFLQAEVG